MRSEMHRHPPKGFSLVELLVVVAIIATMAAVGLPQLAGYLRLSRVRGAAADVSSELQRARSKAIQQNVNFGMIFCILNARQFQIFPEDVFNAGPGVADDGTPEGLKFMTRQGFARADVQNQEGTIVSLPPGIEFVPRASGGPFVRFTRLGSACNPAPSGSPACIPVAAIVDAPAGATGNFFDELGTNRIVTVRDLSNGYELDITVSSGGRIVAER